MGAGSHGILLNTLGIGNVIITELLKECGFSFMNEGSASLRDN